MIDTFSSLNDDANMLERTPITANHVGAALVGHSLKNLTDVKSKCAVSPTAFFAARCFENIVKHDCGFRVATITA